MPVVRWIDMANLHPYCLVYSKESPYVFSPLTMRNYMAHGKFILPVAVVNELVN